MQKDAHAQDARKGCAGCTQKDAHAQDARKRMRRMKAMLAMHAKGCAKDVQEEVCTVCPQLLFALNYCLPSTTVCPKYCMTMTMTMTACMRYDWEDCD